VYRYTSMIHSCRGPYTFHKFLQAVVWCMARCSHNGIIGYLDDFLCIHSLFEGCKRILLDLICLVRKVGFWTSYSKVDGPTQCVTLLGVEIDTVCMELRLPECKLVKCKDVLRFSLFR